MDTIEAVRAVEDVCILGEGPIWDPFRSRVLWVDIRRGMVFSADHRSDGTLEVRERVEFGETVGAVAVSPTGDWLVAGATGLFFRSPDGAITRGPQILPAWSGRRLNDGKSDPWGRFVVGSLSLDGPSTTETLVRVGLDGQITVLDDDLTLSNGLAWTASGARMYSIDTLSRTIFVRSYYPNSGAVGPRREFLRVDGLPDGMCLDAEEHLWVAMWGSGEVHRYSPDGHLVSVITVPAPNVSSVAFVGPLLETLVITTATQDLTAEQLAEHPESGRVFTVEPKVLGLPQTAWRGPVLL